MVEDRRGIDREVALVTGATEELAPAVPELGREAADLCLVASESETSRQVVNPLRKIANNRYARCSADWRGPATLWQAIARANTHFDA